MGCDSSKVYPTFEPPPADEAVSHFLLLPADVHLQISDFTGWRALSHVCQRTWALLKHRHLTFRANGPAALGKLLQVDPQTHSLTVTCQGPHPWAHTVLPRHTFSRLVSLADLRLTLRLSGLKCHHVSPLSALAHVGTLTNLCLDLEGNAVADDGARALAAISTARGLTAVALNLQRNAVTDAGAGALAAFREAPALRTLDLNLQSNRLGDAGVQALAALHAAPALQTLRLDLSNGRFADPRPLAALGRARALTDLALSVACNKRPPDERLAALCAALVARPLTRLSLGLAGTHFGTRVGAHSLSGLQPPATLRAFHLDLRCAAMVAGSHLWLHPILHLRAVHTLTSLSLNLRSALRALKCPADQLMSVALLRGLPPLEELCLDVGENPLTADCVAWCAGLGRAPRLRTLRLRLDQCSLGPGAARPLAELMQSRTLRDVLLDLRFNRLQDEDLCALARLRLTPGLTALRLELSERTGYFTAAGIRALGLLARGASLRSLHFVFSTGGPRPGAARSSRLPGLPALAQLLDMSRALANVTLDVGPNFDGDSAARLVAGLRHAPSLTSLSLGMQYCLIGDSDAEALAKLRQAPGLTTCCLWLSKNRVGLRGAQALATLRHAPALTNLLLDLTENQLLDEGARALGSLRHSSTLRALTLRLDDNGIHPSGLPALCALLKTPTLTDLSVSPTPQHSDRIVR